jgi:hypothetical protein
MPNNIGLLSNRVKKVPSTAVDEQRYAYLDLENAEPDWGVPPLENGVAASDPLGTRKWLNFDAEKFFVTSEDIITLNLDNIVDTESNQVITGDKFFTGNVTIGSDDSTIIGSALTVDGVIEADALLTKQAEFNLVDNVATKINFGGQATDINIGSSTGTTTINNNLRILGEVNIVGRQPLDGGFY